MKTIVQNPVVTKEQYADAYRSLTQTLQDGLPAHLSYHCYQHTLSVIDATEHLVQKEGVPSDDYYLVLTAALYHDAGFMRGYQTHEELSCDIARETLPGLGFANETVEKVCRLIMATRLPQAPSDLYEQILCDADLYYLGSPNFFRDAENLYKEWKAVGLVQTHEEWEAKQLLFLEGHHYFTPTASHEQNEKKKANL